MPKLKILTHVVYGLLFASACLVAERSCGQFTTVMNIPPDPDIRNNISIGSNTQVNLGEGGSIGDYFNAGTPTTSNENLEVNISGGTVGRGFDAYDGSQINISGGSLGLNSYNGSEVNLSGGRVSFFRAHEGSAINIYGNDFRLGGEIVSGLDTVGNTVSVTVPDGVTLSGLHPSGEPFIFGRGDTLAEATITLVAAEPTTEVPSLITVPTDPVPSGIGVGQTLIAEDGAFFSGLYAGNGSFVRVRQGAIAGISKATGAVINVEGGTINYDFSIYDNTELNVLGGSVVGSFYAYSGSAVNLFAGSVGYFSEVNESEINISGGIYNGKSTANNSVLNITGGTLGEEFVFNGSEVNIDGGVVSQYSVANESIVNVTDGSVESYFQANQGSVVNISGGTIGRDLMARDDAEINISGGTIESVSSAEEAIISISGGTIMSSRIGNIGHISGGTITNLSSGENSLVNVSGGRILKSFYNAVQGSEHNISGGSFGSNFRANAGSEVNISGGVLTSYFTAKSGSQVNISGGQFGRFLNLETGSLVNMAGGDFRLDGQPIAGLETIGNSIAFNLPDGSVLTGTYADGTPFSYSSLENDIISDGTLTLTSAEIVPIGPSVITIPGDPVPLSIRSGQTLIVEEGGQPYDYFIASQGSTVIIAGGTVDRMNASGSVITMTSGTYGRFNEVVDSEVNIAGGYVGIRATVYSGTVFNISDGIVDRNLYAESGSVVNLSGGLIGPWFTAQSGSELNVSGGDFAVNFGVSSGAELNISGGEFLLNGVPLAGLDNPGDTLAFDIPANSLLSGTLADGSQFSISTERSYSIASGSLTLIAAELPDVGPDVIALPEDPAPMGLRSGQKLIVGDGGLIEDYFTTSWGSTVEIREGAQVGRDFEVVGTELAILGGSVGSFMQVLNGSVADVSAGTVGIIRSYTDSVVNVYGGKIEGIRSNSEVNFSGGLVEGPIIANEGSEISISGGIFSGPFDSYEGSTVNIMGTQFTLDGVDITDTLTLDMSQLITDRDVTLSGLLADGTSFSFFLGAVNTSTEDYFDPGSTLTISLVAGITPGDYNDDGTVDLADYTVWRNNLGADITLPGDTSPGSVTAHDYNVWKQNFGQTSGLNASGDSQNVPEPAGVGIMVAAMLLALGLARKS